MHDEVFKTLHIFTFQGKFIRINFDASGYIAGANIGKKLILLQSSTFNHNNTFRNLLIGEGQNHPTGRGGEIIPHFLPTPYGGVQGVQM